MSDPIVTLVTALLGSSATSSVVVFLLYRRRHSLELATVEADALSRYQAVIATLWKRIDELEHRLRELDGQVTELMREVEHLRQLVRAYERRFGRKFRIENGKVVEVSDEGR